jgi:hypothetical protein
MQKTNVIPPADPTRVWFETALVEDTGGAVYRSAGHRGSRLTFGQPAVYDLEALIRDAGAEPSFEIRSQLDDYEFRLVRLVATLHVEPRAAVSWLEVHVALSPGRLPSAGDGVPLDPPIAHDLYPLRVADKVQVKRTAKISPAFKFNDVQLSIGEAGVATEYERFEPTITAYGKREAAAYWRYTPGNGSEVAGGVREMDLIVRRPRGVPVRARILAKGSGRQWGVFREPVVEERQQFDV